MKLIFATNNAHKIDELKPLVPAAFNIISLREAGLEQEIPEPYHTLEENAYTKSHTIFTLTGHNTLSEDTGLEVDALAGAPGVRSARYAGEHATFSENVASLLANMEAVKNRKARFRTVISLIIAGKEHQFEGICQGQITQQPFGDKGFGYDPIFIPEGSDKTFAQMDIAEKSIFSHRARAVEKLVAHLTQIKNL